jgi:signal recognition particle subunit SRP14
LPILIHATNGKSKEKRAEKVKLSTLVEPDELDVFFGRYAEVCKAGMAALKPRDRTKRKAKARKKKGGAGQAVP